jgi:hypothetical protein
MSAWSRIDQEHVRLHYPEGAAFDHEKLVNPKVSPHHELRQGGFALDQGIG